jgi:glycerol-3-phosphate dehydrogenase (NAD(P)+)
MMKSVPQDIAVLGAGSWGTAVALALAHQGHHVHLWARDTSFLSQHENSKYLPGVPFPPNLKVIKNLTDALKSPNLLIAVPSHAFMDLIAQIPKLPQQGIAWITKGIEPISFRLFSDLLQEKYGQGLPMALISGPSFAKEVAAQKPTALVVAGNTAEIRHHWQMLLHSDINRVYTTEDLIGVQICGAVKNVLAIACGISDGLNYGANSRAALITRGLAEMTQLGLAMGAHRETFSGLAGLGDLVLTCTDNQSRNRRFGLYLGQGFDVDAAAKEVKQVVEGLHNAKQVTSLAKRYQIEMPIAEAVHAVLSNQLNAVQAAKNLLQRPIKTKDKH